MLRLNIVQRLALYVVVIGLIPLGLLGASSFVISTTTIQAEAGRYTEQLVIAQRDYLLLQLGQIESLMTNIAGNERIREILADETMTDSTFTRIFTQQEIGSVINQYITAIRGVVSVDVYTESGLHFTVDETLSVTGIDAAGLARVRAEAIAAAGRIVWLGIESNINVGSPTARVVLAAQMLTRFDRQTLANVPLALLTISYDPGEIYRHLAGVELGAGGYLMLLDAEGRMIYHPEQRRIGSSAARDLVESLAGGETERFVEEVEMSIRQAAFDDLGWRLASFVPFDTLTQPANVIALATWGLLAVGGVIIALAVIAFNRDVTLPLREISGRLRGLREQPEAEQQPLVIGTGAEEIEELARGYNALLEALAIKREADLQREFLIAELRTARSRAEESAQLKSEFLSTMSHELRTPLNAIEGFTSIMLAGMGVQLDARTHKMVERISTNSKRLLGLINDFLDLTRIESGRVDLVYTPLSLVELTEEWRASTSVLAEQKALAFSVLIDPEMPETVYGDAEALSKVVINLLSNAFKFTHDGGVKLAVGCDVGRREWSIAVRDSGIGIPPHALTYIFDEFRQVDQSSTREYGGTGLGLSIVQKLVRLMGGRVDVESVVGQGSTFTITLPLDVR